ncbi:hypothetical protein KPL70_001869 [Citrus sinensis]|nr:hypothetical protein KPL70_001869 [Citrus sinensis]
MESQKSIENELVGCEDLLIFESKDIITGGTDNIPSIGFSKKVHAQLIRPWQHAVVVKLLGRHIGYKALCNWLETLWSSTLGFSIIDLENDYFIFSFKVEGDVEFALTQGPWTIMGHYLIVQPWTFQFDASMQEIHLIIAWIRLLSMAFHYYYKRMLRKLRQIIGMSQKKQAAIKTSHNENQNSELVTTLTTITKPTTNINSVSLKDISTSNFDSHKAQPQEDPRNHAILGKTMNMDDDDDNSEYMGESKNVMESFEKDISLDDENAIDRAALQNFRRSFKSLTNNYKPTLVVILESQISGIKADDFIQKNGFDKSYRVEVNGFSRGIWLLWKGFFEENLGRIVSSIQGLWLVSGDFNSILYASEKQGRPILVRFQKSDKRKKGHMPFRGSPFLGRNTLVSELWEGLDNAWGRNTMFFHQKTRRRWNRIDAITNDSGQWLNDTKYIKQYAVGCFSALYTEENNNLQPYLSNFFFPVLDGASLSLVNGLVNDMEIKNVVFSMKPLKAPRVDGLNAIFYQSQWSVVGPSICHFVKEEVMPSMRNNKGTKGQMAIKMDLKKSYDRLSRSFIHETLLEAGIPTDFVQIIMECVTTIQMNLLRNGELINEFRPSKGIRQGDPISAYIFVLFIERLGHGICHTVNMGRWKPIRLSQHCIFLTYLFFADDILLLAEALCEQATILCSVLGTYCSGSGARPPGDVKGEDQVFWTESNNWVFTMKCAYNVISIAKHRDEGQIWKIIWQTEGPQSFHIALTLDANYLRGTIAAIFLILQHSTCPQSLSFHFLLARFEPELISSIKSTFPYLNFKIYGFDSKRVHGKISRSIRQGLDQPLNYAKNLSC